jgi:DNA mismatch repair protein MutL
MSDLIRLLPDSVANQIAAGEVVQRPASAAKELLENTIDSGATDVKLIIREAGKSLIQVVDNGCGMSERDARMCFERHATSKIQSADDLMAIRTLGFRGEALASIASVAQVELKTKREGDETGSCVQIEGTEFISQFPVSSPAGTSIAVKNLFYNVPARRNFLKSNTLELKYLIEEFFRISLANPSVAFTLYNQDKILFQLPASNLKQRIVNLFGTPYNQRLIPVEQTTALISISGFIGKPEYAKKTRGEQYFFTNGRFMKSPYLHHAIENAFRELVPDDAFPSYFIFFEIDPKSIDVNIHPTKTEINFQEIKSIYAILHAAIKQTIGRFSISPTLDFEAEQGIIIPPMPENHPVRSPSITVNPDFNPVEKRSAPQTRIDISHRERPDTQALHSFFEPVIHPEEVPAVKMKACFQLENSYIITHSGSGLVIIDQQQAHQRIIYEKILDARTESGNLSQKLLIPETVTLSPDDALLMSGWLDQFRELGFDIAGFGKDAYVVHAIPSTLTGIPVQETLESALETLKSSAPEPTAKKDHLLARSIAVRTAVRAGKRLEKEEMEAICEQLFACRFPEISPEGKPTMMIVPMDEINKKLKKKLPENE